MKIPKKRELQQITTNHSSDIDFESFMKFYRKRGATGKTCSLIVNDTNLASDNTLRFGCSLLERA